MKTIFLVLFVCALSVDSFAQVEKVQSKFKFVLREARGEDVTFDTLLGSKPVLLSFWASWCEPCKQELKAFQNLSTKYGGKLNVVAINIDKVKSLSKVRSYIATQGFTFPVLLDPGGEVALSVFSVESLPNSFLLRPSGMVERRFGEYTAIFEAEVDQAIKELLKGTN